MNNDFNRQVIMEHSESPRNKIEQGIEGYKKKEALNPSCGDHITIYIKEEDGILTDIKFVGNGCNICCASASVMTIELLNLNELDAKTKIEKFRQIIKDGVIDEEIFEDAQAFVGIQSFPGRYKCAAISWDTLYKMLEGEIDE